MSRQRTPEQRKIIIDRCVAIEKEGGDVLAYLSSEGYISPRGTWMNIQKCDLHRKIFTDGKPVQKKKTVQRRAKCSKEEKQAIIAEVIRILLDGGDADTYLTSIGYRNAPTIRRNIVHKLKDSDPDTHAAILAAKAKQKRKPKPESRIAISQKNTPEDIVAAVPVVKMAPLPQPIEGISFRFIPLRDIRTKLKNELAAIDDIDSPRYLEIEEDLRCLERVRQLGLEAIRGASA